MSQAETRRSSSEVLRRWGAPATALSGLALVVLSIASWLLVDRIGLMNALTIAAAGSAVLVLGFLLSRNPRDRGQVARVTLAAGALGLKTIAALAGAYWAWTAGSMALAALGFWLLWAGTRATSSQRGSRAGRRAVVGGVSGVGALLAVLTVTLAVVSVDPDPVVTPAARLSIGSTDNIEEADEVAVERADGVRVVQNVRYGTRYPNSFLDVYSRDAQAPTFFYVHGGAYVGGDKAEGDPFAAGDGGAYYIDSLLDSGFNVVSVNYALAPEFTYPTPVVQLTEALAFLKGGAPDFGLDMDRVVIGGSSAGGQLAGQVANIQSNPDYAEEMDVAQPLDDGDLRAVVFASALLNPERFAQTGEVVIGYGWYQYGRQYFDTNFLQRDPDVIQSDVLRHVSADMPPTYISDGNTASFYAQANAMSERLERLGVAHELHIPPKSDGSVTHGFESKGDPVSRDSFDRMVAFLRANGVFDS